MKQHATPESDVATGGPTGSTQAGPAIGGPAGEAFMLQNSIGNAGIQEMIGGSGEAGEEEVSKGLANYQSALGKALGTKLYEALAPHLTMDKMSGYANDGLTGAIEGLVGLLEGMETDAGSVDKFAEALSKQYAAAAGEWLKANPKVVDAIRGWVDGHPKTIAITAVTAALLAAAGAILSDQDIPELKHTFKIGDALTADLAAKLGSFQNIALEKISAKLAYTAGNLQAGLEVSSENLEGLSGSASLSIGDDERKASLTGEFTEEGLSLYEFSGHLGIGEGRTIKGSSTGDGTGLGVTTVTLSSVDGENTTSNSIAYDAKTDVFTITDAEKQVLGDGSTVTASRSQSTDGSQDVSATYENENDSGLSTRFSLGAMIQANGAETAYDLTTQQRLGFGLSYTTRDLQAEFDAAFSTDGNNSFKGELTNDFGGGHTAGTNVDWATGNKEHLNIGAFYGYKNAETFSGFLSKYSYASENDAHKLNLQIDHKLGDIYARLEQEAVLSAEGERFQTSATGAYFLDNGIGLIGGVKYQVNEAGEHNFLPVAGAQVGGIPLTVTYDPRNNGVSVGLSIPFGR